MLEARHTSSSGNTGMMGRCKAEAIHRGRGRYRNRGRKLRL